MNQERIYTVLREPHISEKVSVLGDIANQYAFKVAPDATRAEIREAVEAIFKVSVTKKNWKKAYVTVVEGQEIDFMVTE
jgi:large subunit ribosomal protein L23